MNEAGPTTAETTWGPPPFPLPPERDERDVAAGRPVAWTPAATLRAGRVVLGGSPWSVTVLPEDVRDLARLAAARGRAGTTASTPEERRSVRFLLDRGMVDPLPAPAGAPDRSVPPVDDVEVVIPVHGDPGPLERCLASLAPTGLPVTVVDDASAAPHARRIAELVAAHGARLVRHETNTGPGGARNTGFAATSAPFVAFIDADTLVPADGIARLRPLLDDERCGAVGPRVLPDVQGDSVVEQYEERRSELDMGAVPSLVVHGVPVGWLPSAAVLVRRSAVTTPPFEPGLRVGEDVDLFWRMDEAGWAVRYAPDVVVWHEVRPTLRDFVGRRAMYGGSAALLEQRHPRRLTPASPSWSGMLVLAAGATGRPVVASAISVYELARQRALLDGEVPWPVVVEMTGRSLWSDAYWLGHLLRRDWWPVGWLVLAASPRSALARGVAAAMLWEPVRDHVLTPARLSPVRSLVMRLIDDASYGTGVIRGAVRHGVANVVTPRPRIPWWPRRDRG